MQQFNRRGDIALGILSAALLLGGFLLGVQVVNALAATGLRADETQTSAELTGFEVAGGIGSVLLILAGVACLASLTRAGMRRAESE